MDNTQAIIDSIDAALQHLNANAASMPLDIMRRTRSEAMQMGIALMEERIDDLTNDQMWQINDLIVHLDRVGY